MTVGEGIGNSVIDQIEPAVNGALREGTRRLNRQLQPIRQTATALERDMSDLQEKQRKAAAGLEAQIETINELRGMINAQADRAAKLEMQIASATERLKEIKQLDQRSRDLSIELERQSLLAEATAERLDRAQSVAGTVFSVIGFVTMLAISLRILRRALLVCLLNQFGPRPMQVV